MDRPIRWGCHVSSEGKNLARLAESVSASGMSCFQIFFGSSGSFERRKLTVAEADDLREVLTRLDISFNTHFPYALNLCRDDVRLDSLQTEVNRVAAVGGRVVVHTGSCVDGKHANRDVKAIVETQYGPAAPQAKPTRFVEWEQDWMQGADALIKHVRGLEFPNDQISLLLEPPAGEGKKLGWHLKQIAYIFASMPPQVGFCLDTCHAFAAGACRFSTGREVEDFFAALGTALGGIHKLKLIHLNDSEGVFGSMKDLHATLGQGQIWGEEENLDGLVALWLCAQKFGVDIVSEVGTPDDITVMRGLNA